MTIKNGDFVRLNFTGKVKETNDVFDTTFEEVAKEADIFVEKKTYEPIPIVVGGNHLLPTIEEAIVGLKKGDSKTVEVDVDNAFGQRNTDMIRLIPMKEFKKQGMTPYKGMKITFEGNTGRILTVSGGRVKVDFNHELAGKDLVYDVEVVEIIDDDIEKVKSMINLHYSYPNMNLDNAKIEIEDKICNIKLEEIAKFDQKSYMDVTFARFRIAKDIWDNMDVEKVNFVDEFEKKGTENKDDAGEE